MPPSRHRRASPPTRALPLPLFAGAAAVLLLGTAPVASAADDPTTLPRLSPTSADFPASNDAAFAAVCNGSLVAWGAPLRGGDAGAAALAAAAVASDVASLSATAGAFAALGTDGSVAAWGSAAHGGDAATVSSHLTGVQSVHATAGAFAAVNEAGEVAAWGDASRGGNTSTVADLLVDVRAVYSTRVTFAAAVGSESRVVTWGRADTGTGGGGDASEILLGAPGSATVVTTQGAFAARTADGSVVVWGDAAYGGDAAVVQAELQKAELVTATSAAFAAVSTVQDNQTTGSFVAWGSADHGGDAATVAELLHLEGVVRMAGTDSAFAAVTKAGGVVAWGDNARGGDHTGSSRSLEDVARLYSTAGAFAAVTGQGAVAVWGEQGSGGDDSAVHSDLASGVESVASTDGAFAALKSDGSVVAWGSPDHGGDASTVADLLAGGVASLHATASAFAAVKENGTVVAWGAAAGGGDAAAAADFFAACAEQGEEPATPAPTDAPATEAPTPSTGYVFCLDLQADECAEKAQWCRVAASGQGCEFRDDCSAHSNVADCRYTPQCWWDAKLEVCSVDDLCFRIGRQPHCELAGCSWVWNANRCTSRHSACGGYDKDACAAAVGRCLYDDAGAACRPVAGCAGLDEAACAAAPRCGYAAGACLVDVPSCAVFSGKPYCRVRVTQTEVQDVPCEGIRSEYAVNVLLGATVSEEQPALAVPKDVWRNAKNEASGEPACGSLDDERTRCLPCAAGYVLNPAATVRCFNDHVLGFVGQLCVRPGEACAMRPAEKCYAPACHVEPKDVCSDAVPPGCTGLAAFECLAKGAVCDRDATGACMDAPCAAGVPKTACEGARYPAGGSGSGRVCAWEKDSAACSAAAVEAAQCAALPDGLCLGALTPCGWENGRCVACADAGTRSECKAASLIGCDWSAAEQCEPIRKACGALKTSEVCLRDGLGCAWTAEDGCFDPKKQCTDYASESACNLVGPGSALNLGCAWVGERCVPAKVVCETLARNDCAFNTRCVWDKTIDICVQTDVCTTAEDEPVCVALGCAWVANHKMCSSLQSGCAGRDEDECTGQNCAFDKERDVCATVAGCQGAPQDECGARRGCAWSADSSSCVVQGRGATCRVLNLGAATPACLVNGTWAPCARISSAYKAGSPLRLERDLNDGTSILAAHTGRVLTHDLKQLCPEGAACHFCEPGSVMNPNAAVFCDEAGGGVLRIRGELCVSPDACALKVASTCTDGCEWNMQEAECRPERCRDLEEAACSSDDDCAWLTYGLVKLCAAAPIRGHCQNAETPEVCSGRYHCAYNAAKAECRGVDAVQLCTGKPFADCLHNGGMCEWDTASLTCVPFNCKLIGKETECTHRHCEWNASPGVCDFKAGCETQGLVRCSSDPSLKCGMVYQGEKPAVCVACGSYGSADACGHLVGCMWNPLQSTCIHVSCGGRPNDASCDFVDGCFWDAAAEECVEAARAPPCAARERCTDPECVSGAAPAATCTEAPVDCSAQNQASCGKHASCWWDVRDGACQAHEPCAYIEEAKACGAAACTWVASLEVCVAFTVDCAEKAGGSGENATECAGAFCGFVLDADSKEEECQVHVGCDGLSEASCDTAWWNCTYSTKESKCVADAQPMCDSLDLSGNACEVDGVDGPCVGVSKAWGSGLIRTSAALRDGSLMLQADPGYSWYAAHNQSVCLPGASCEVCAGGLVLNPFAVVRCVEGAPASIVGVLCIPPERVCRSDVEVCLGQQHPSPPTQTFESCTAPDEESCVEARVPWSTYPLCTFDAAAGADGCRLTSLCTGTNAYAQCFVLDGAQVVPGFCSPEDGQCVAGPPGGDCLLDVATKECGIADGAFRNRCFDPDRTANGAFECVCSVDETWEHTTRTCVANPNYCPLPESRSACEAKHKVCRVLQGGPECLDRMCTPPADSFCDGHDRAGCEPALTPDANNCAAFPCAQFNCTSSCGVEDKEKCMLQGMTEGKHLRCEIGIVGATCVEIECSTPKCSLPPAGCYYIPDSRVDPLTHCPVLPCGKLYCPKKCLPRSEAACTLKKMRCLKGEDGLDRCTAYQCPVPDCNPPPGCAYQWSADENPAKDRNGCPYAPCGTLQCGRSICSDGTNCCPPSGPCKICVGDRCVTRPNPFAAAACLPVAGCTFHGARAAGSPTPCGVEECAPARLCDVIRCASGRCEVAYDAGGIPFPNCLPVTETCQGCASRACTWDEEGVVACVPVPTCATTVCPAGMACYDGADGTETPRCFPRDVAACGGCLDDPEAVCELVRGAEGEESTVACVKRHPAGARCERDGCACAGAPCQGLEQCVQHSFTTRREVTTKLVTVGCAVVSDAAADTRDVDPCGSVLCGAGRECVHHPSRAAASCRPVPAERCRGTVCTPPALCNERTGVCENTDCVPACPLDEQCMFVSGASACVRNKCPKEDEWWLAGTCLTDTDCDGDVFSVCPAPTSTLLEAYVSAHCTCDPVTGKAARCVREPHPTRRRCIRARWNCNVADHKTWSPAEHLWCCQNRQIGCCLDDQRQNGGCATDYKCTTPDDPTTWSYDKIGGCCQKTQLRGCPLQLTPPLPPSRSRAASVLVLLTEYDCTTEEEFTYDKKKHCCTEKKIACPVPEKDCSSTTLTATEKARCCTTEGKHCVAPPNLYDCKSTGLWSPLQAKYCCRVHGLGCTGEKSPHDCGGESTGADWDYYCCAKASRGCKPNDAPTGPYECYDGMYRVEKLPVLKLSVPERVAEWCCSFRGLGCKQRDFCLVQFEVSSDDETREACCASTGIGCKFTCSEGVQWTAEEEEYCCRTGGSQCNAQELSETVAAQEALLKTLPHAVVEAKIQTNWNEIAQKPKLFARKAAYSLRFLLHGASGGAFSDGNATVQIMEVGPLTPSGEHPANDSALYAQAIGTPWAWSKEQDASTTGLPSAVEHVSPAALGRSAHVLQTVTPDMTDVYVRIAVVSDTVADAKEHSQALVHAGVHLFALGLDGLGFVAPMRSPASVISDGGAPTAVPGTAAPDTPEPDVPDTPSPPPVLIPKSSDGTAWWVYVVIGLVGLCVLGGVGAVCSHTVFKRNRDDDSSDEGEDYGGSVPVGFGETQSPQSAVYGGPTSAGGLNPIEANLQMQPMQQIPSPSSPDSAV